MSAAVEPLRIEARGVHAGYGSSVVVRDLSIAIAAGEVVALIGPNGAGKSTTLMTVAGALTPLRGQILSGGQPAVNGLHRRARVGLSLITEKRAVLMQLTVAENLRVAKAPLEAALAHFPELEPHLKRRVADLSGGQQQMLALARALAREPQVLLADELSLGLAPLIVDRLLGAVRQAADRGVGVLLVEQHVRKVFAIADRILVMRRGRIEIEGQAEELRDHVDAIQASYLS